MEEAARSCLAMDVLGEFSEKGATFKKIDNNISRRHEIADRYNKLLSDFPLTLPYQSANGYSAFHLYVIRLNEASKHKNFYNELRVKGIGVNLHYIPIYRQPYYQRNGQNYGHFPESESYYSEAITIPLYPTMSNQDQDMVVKAIKESL